MVWRLFRALTLTTLCCALALSACAQFVRSAQADLNGDKQLEKITLTLDKKDASRFTLTIGQATIVGELDMNIDGFQVIDIDKWDQYKEVAVHTPGPSEDHAYRIYWYDGKTIKEMALLNGIASFPGNGIVYVESWTDCFWTRMDKYVLNKQTRKLDFVKQPFYYVGVTAAVDSSIPIYATTDIKTPVANLLPKSKVLILLNDGKYYLLKSTTGLVGWVKIDVLQHYFSDLPWAD